MKKQDVHPARTAVIDTETGPQSREETTTVDFLLGSKLDALTDPAIRVEVAARLRLIEANLLDRLPAEPAPEREATAQGPVPTDASKKQSIVAALRKKPQA